jgi:hypothetical protein
VASGSIYRINGREVRARDVQLLFADAATGAHSTALVSQGRIGAIINAKPTDRRGLLEEAAASPGCIRAGTRPSLGCARPRATWHGSTTSSSPSRASSSPQEAGSAGQPL